MEIAERIRDNWMAWFAMNALAQRYNAVVKAIEWGEELAYQVKNERGTAIYVDRGDMLELVSQN